MTSQGEAMAEHNGTFTEEEVNQMLARQAINLRLDGVEGAITKMTDELAEHMRDEAYSQEAIMSKLTESVTERRKTEADLRQTIASNHETYHNLFVKKADLRLYAIIMVAAVTMTVSVITWIGSQTAKQAQTASMAEVIKRLDKALADGKN